MRFIFNRIFGSVLVSAAIAIVPVLMTGKAAASSSPIKIKSSWFNNLTTTTTTTSTTTTTLPPKKLQPVTHLTSPPPTYVAQTSGMYANMPDELLQTPTMPDGSLAPRESTEYQNAILDAIQWVDGNRGPYRGKENVWWEIQSHEQGAGTPGWAEHGPRCEGGLGFCGSYPSRRWPQMPLNAGDATPNEQIVVAEKIFKLNHNHFCGSWSSCHAAGVR